MSLFIDNARLVSGAGGPIVPDARVRINGDKIVALGTKIVPEVGDRIIDADGRVLLPGFVDAHTHALWAGDRLAEFELKLAGKSYLEILAGGGGIHATVRAVRAASEAELAELLLRRLNVMLREGATTIEVKSGYGLSTEHELKMLRAIRAAAERFSGTIVATALLGHAKDPEQPDFVERVVSETLPAVHAEFPGLAIDAFCEEGAFSVAECRRLFEAARALGHPLRLHTDQFNALGGLELALELGARSVDHLEVTPPEALQRLGRSGTFAVMLPAGGFHLDGRYASGRALLDAGGKLVLASNCNPGSSPTSSLPFVLALAMRKLGLKLDEALRAITSSAAELLGLDDRGSVAVGKRADLVLLRHRDERLLGYEVGGNPVDTVICGGRLVSG
ncbi:MAG TPA: imidazolonepropionase [Polyangiaceae bacterium]|nr:imidazolonepropionase [Polyangiaceae bacterium]